MKYYIISSVRNATKETREKLESYALALEMEGHEVHLPHRDTPQDIPGFEICAHNLQAISDADEIKIFWDPASMGSHFDLGMCFVMDKPFEYVDGPEPSAEKSFTTMMVEWQAFNDAQEDGIWRTILRIWRK